MSQQQQLVNLFLSLLLLGFKTTSSFSLGSRSILRAIIDDNDNDNKNGKVVDLQPHDYAVDLNATNFDAVLRDTPATFAVVEFFAHWCPACRNYKPHYERVARLFNGQNAVHPGIILMTRVDCALKLDLVISPSPFTFLAAQINTKLCDKFSVGHYPMLFWAPPPKFVSGGWEPKQEKSEIRVIDDPRTADRLLNWINKEMGSSFGLDDEKFENENLSSNASDPEQIARAVYDVEEATSTAFDFILEHKMIKSETRASIIKFLQLLVAHHPSRRCRKGSAEVLVNFDDLCPIDMGSTNTQESTYGKEGALGNIQICGKDVPRGYWVNEIHENITSDNLIDLNYWRLLLGILWMSRLAMSSFSAPTYFDDVESLEEVEIIAAWHPLDVPSSNEFLQCCADCGLLICGLWVLLHSLSVRIEDGESQFAFTAICEFVHDFFICEECRQHFYEMCSSVSSPFNKTRDFALWLWSAHNKVNERLIKEEASLGTADPKFPKMVWPPKQLCSSCHLSQNQRNNGINWDQDKVFKFLTNYYGKMLVSIYKDKNDRGNDVSGRALEDLVVSTNAVVVPLGAALAIAVASCAFGALACYWRSQQKSQGKAGTKIVRRKKIHRQQPGEIRLLNRGIQTKKLCTKCPA
uniref:Sulfhydryl oxidase n=1 Tax=Fagus sylvatica TaxID=28930 RepID=A0A2N9FN44_FAGSY